jgi:alpha-amylase/alpha-mannosidase (GH57 family)
VNETTLILCVHNHQPVGNLPGVFEQATRDAYVPFLDVIEKFPEIKFVLHNSGPLLEWYEEHAPDYIERVRRLVERGQVEILTGGFYEPILSGVPARDAIAQIRKMTDYVTKTFEASPRGMWLAERVWEPRLPGTLARASVEYVPLDDYEFRLAGLADLDLTGYFVTEDQGHPVKVFPISKKLRYSIPFAEPEVTIAHMRVVAERGPGRRRR